MNSKKELFLYNRSSLDASSYKKLTELESSWIAEIFDSIPNHSKIISSRKEFQDSLDNLLKQEHEAPSDDADYVANRMSLEEFRVILQEFAVDGLTEAQAFFTIIPKLPIKAQMPILRIVIDEFGCGNLQQLHSNLYRNLLTELGMSTNFETYLDILNSESYDFLNIFYWMTNRASSVAYFLGALAYLESMIPFSFQCFADACNRLNILHHQYYTEHMHIDRFHAKEALLALREVELSVGINYTKAWQGVQIASLVTGRAFEAAIEKAIRLNETNGNDLPNCHPAETESNFDSSPDYIPEHFSVDLKGKEYLIPVACPHRKGRLNCGLINDKTGTITCPLHFSKFEIASGKRISGPAQQSLNIVENNNRVNGTETRN